MNEEEKNAFIRPEAERTISENEEKPLGYWARIAKIYQHACRGLIIALILFVVLFAVLSPSAFSFDGLFYFVKDLGATAALADAVDPVLYYTYGEAAMMPLSYHGGVALAHSSGVEVYKAGGRRSLTVSLPMENPRVVASRNYLVAFDFGGTSFSFCNAYAELYRGTTEFPIYGITVSDTGYFAVITASDRALSQVLLYDGSYHLVQRFYRSSATVDVAFSDNGRYIALLGARAEGGILDVFMIGDSEPISGTRFDGELPLALGFTSATTIGVITDRVLYTLHVDGKRYNTVSFHGEAPVAYSFGREGIAVVLEADAVRAIHRVLLVERKGETSADITINKDIQTISASDGVLWVLTADSLCAYDIEDGKELRSFDIDEGAIGASGIDANGAYVFYAARAEKHSLAD